MDADEELQRVSLLRDLGSMDRVPVGTRVHVEEDGFIYTGVGQTTPDIMDRVGWTHANIWLPEHVRQYVLHKRRGVFPNLFELVEEVVTKPLSVHVDQVRENVTYFLADGTILRDLGLLRSNSTRYVDAAVELRQVPSGNVLRLFHLSPRDLNQGGKQLWP